MRCPAPGARCRRGGGRRADGRGRTTDGCHGSDVELGDLVGGDDARVGDGHRHAQPVAVALGRQPGVGERGCTTVRGRTGRAACPRSRGTSAGADDVVVEQVGQLRVGGVPGLREPARRGDVAGQDPGEGGARPPGRRARSRAGRGGGRGVGERVRVGGGDRQHGARVRGAARRARRRSWWAGRSRVVRSSVSRPLMCGSLPATTITTSARRGRAGHGVLAALAMILRGSTTVRRVRKFFVPRQPLRRRRRQRRTDPYRCASGGARPA